MEKIYSVKQTAKILGFSTNTVYKYLDEETIKAARGSGQQGRYRIPHSSIEKFLGATVSEEQIQNALNPKKLTSLNLLDKELPQKESSTPKTFPVSIARGLIIFSLLIIIIDLIVSHTFSLITQLLRMAIISIFILLAYQSGGYSKPPTKKQ